MDISIDQQRLREFVILFESISPEEVEDIPHWTEVDFVARISQADFIKYGPYKSDEISKSSIKRPKGLLGQRKKFDVTPQVPHKSRLINKSKTVTFSPQVQLRPIRPIRKNLSDDDDDGGGGNDDYYDYDYDHDKDYDNGDADISSATPNNMVTPTRSRASTHDNGNESISNGISSSNNNNNNNNDNNSTGSTKQNQQQQQQQQPYVKVHKLLDDLKLENDLLEDLIPPDFDIIDLDKIYLSSGAGNDSDSVSVVGSEGDLSDYFVTGKGSLQPSPQPSKIGDDHGGERLSD